MPFDDEMPEAPNGAVVAAGAVTIDGGIDASLFDAVPNMGDALPAGVYHVRLKSFSEKVSTDNPPQPYFSIMWAVQQEPHVGRVVFDNVPWVNASDVQLAVAGNPQAQAVLSDRLPRSKQIIKAAEFKPVGKFDFKAFLGSNPELKIQVGVTAKKAQNAAGNWVATDEMKNTISKYISLVAPR
jgi:hypothetical protein